MRTAAIGIVILAGLGPLPACGDKLEGSDPFPQEVVLDLSGLSEVSGASPEEFTYGWLYDNLLRPSCSASGCHETRTPFGNAHLTFLDFSRRNDSYDQLIGKFSIDRWDWKRVEPGRPERSYLMAKLLGDSLADKARMPPPPADRADPELVARVAKWIERGALDD